MNVTILRPDLVLKFCFVSVIKVIKVRSIVARVLGSIIYIVQELIDAVFNNVFNRTLRRMLSERRLAHLIRLGHGEFFY